jgi:dTDP-4-amino-4,6-dideoxygalactose transaminase
MMDLQAAIGIHQLARLDKHLERRAQIWREYDEAFRDLPVRLPGPVEPETVHARHLYTPMLDLDRLKVDRDCILGELRQEGVGTGVHYVSLHLQPYYRQAFGYKEGDFPRAEEVSRRTLSLPLSANLTDAQVERVIAAFREVLLRHVRN